MMKEWKNNPGSDEENAAEQKNKWSNQEKLEGSHLSRPGRAARDVASTSDEDEEKQVGRTSRTSRKNSCFFLQTVKYPPNTWNILCQNVLFLLVFVAKALRDETSKVLSSLRTVMM